MLVLSVENAHLTTISAKDAKKGLLLYGLKLVKGTLKEEFFHEDRSVIEKWAFAMDSWIIKTGFSSLYSNVKTLGKGNFARVQLVENKATKQLSAVKIFDKKLISSDKLEKVLISLQNLVQQTNLVLVSIGYEYDWPPQMTVLIGLLHSSIHSGLFAA